MNAHESGQTPLQSQAVQFSSDQGTPSHGLTSGELYTLSIPEQFARWQGLPGPARPISENAPREKRSSNYNGIKFFDGNPLPKKDIMTTKYREVTADQLREDMRVWRPEETLDAAQPFFNKGRVNVVGDPQSGKGTILFGLSEICHVEGWGYLFIDGHHQEADSQTVVDSIRAAERRGIPVFFDSFDYLFIKGKSRGISATEQRERIPIILGAVIDASVPIAITNHNEEWAASFLNLELREQYRHILDSFPVYEIPLHFRSDQSIERFLRDSDFSVEQSQALSQLEQSEEFVNFLVNHYGDKAKAGEVLESAKNYPVLKELARDRKDEVLQTLGQNQDDASFAELARIILESEHKRRFLTFLRKSK